MKPLVVGLLVLAAGESRRFGSDKRLYLLNGKPLLQHTLEAAQASGLPVRVCLRGDIDPALDIVQAMGLAAISCDHSEQGMGATLAQGVSACADWDGLLVVLGDMAWIAPATYRVLAAALQPGGIVRPVNNGRAGNPVGFSRHYFPQLSTLAGDVGAREILSQNTGTLRSVEVGDAGVLRDVDHPEGLEQRK